MKLVLPLDGLDPNVRAAFEALQIQIAETWQQANTADGQSKRTLLSAYGNTTQSHTTSGNWEAVTFNAEDDLRAIATIAVPVGVHDTTTRPDRFIVPGNPGEPQRWLRLRVRVTFEANATGSRGVRVLVNDVDTHRSVFVRAATATAATRVSAMAGFAVLPGQAIAVEAFQDSGGALNLGSTSRAGANECEWELI